MLLYTLFVMRLGSEDGVMRATAELLLEGPRGRRLCLELACEADPDIRSSVFDLGYELDSGRGTSVVRFTLEVPDTEPRQAPVPVVSWSRQDLAAALSTVRLPPLDDASVLEALWSSVDTARYWQEPDGQDILASLPVICDALLPIAEHLMASPHIRWFSDPRGVEQWVIDWRAADDPAPLARNPGSVLAEWGTSTRAEEEAAAHDRPRDPHANWSGTWWSVPVFGLVHTVGRIPEALDLVEDSSGWEEATVIPVHGTGRVLEIGTAEDWVSLCREFPLEVTASRRHDWFRVSGRDVRWVIPDWERVAGRWDAVHLSVLGYLSTATRALEIDATTATMIAGWNPNTTIWLTDRVREWEGPRQTWRRSSGNDPWFPAP